MNVTPRLLNSTDAATYLSVTPRHLRELVYRRDIPFTKVGRLLRFDVQKLDRWIDRHTTKAAS